MSSTPAVEQKRNGRLWTPANIVTVVRICLVPVFVVALLSPWPQWFGLPQVADDAKSLIAAGIFILISATDWLDGYLARSRGEVTDFGKFMDPLADKILVAAALLALIELGALPSWVVLVILAREFIVSGVRMLAASEGVVIAASWYGKFKTVFQMIAIVLFTIKDNHMVGDIGMAFSDGFWILSWIVMIIALILTVVSMLDYIVKARHLIGFVPKNKKSCQSIVSGNTLPSSPDLTTLESMAVRVIDLARKQNITLGAGESLTGGLITAMLTTVAGSSAVVTGGVVSYANEAKENLLGVSKDTLCTTGAVSEETAREMAEGVRSKLNVDIAVSVTGIAGPGGAVANKPVGTVWFALATDSGTQAQCRHFQGDRESVRNQTVSYALELIMQALER